MRTPTTLCAVRMLAVALLLVPYLPTHAACVAIYDRPASHVIKDLGDCIHVIDGEDGVATGSHIRPGPPYYNIWLFSPTGCVTASSDSVTSVVCIQYHSSDGDDGVSDIYIDDMSAPLVRIDTYLRGSWYVEISDLSPGPHEVKVCASGNASMIGVIPRPHRPTPAMGPNDIWDFCFTDTPTPVPDGSPDPAYSEADWLNLTCGNSKVLAFKRPRQ